ncbi:ribosome maturation factor RimM [Phenylobacterium sp. 58.2.17]|uniref:ribosome maturation factor RimM n=1 Tax=Phenylobacterium sp. 58.2.17 TaxID=2969306 RepID=UPI002263C250|nr:ribosome maturation factor RimM [Phenylobacterium sp. 58.2.17]MCX7586902.1 ribosome maturation factor RimM [Phenylobacterium sp. 58.2.17]
MGDETHNLIFVAQVGAAHGVRGEVKVTTFTADPMALASYKGLMRQDGSPALTIASARPTKGGIVARLKGVDDRNAAEALRGLKLYISRDSLPEPDEDEFYLADLIGLAVETTAGELLGKVKTVQDFGAGDLLEIQPKAGASWWLPFTREAVPEVRIAEGRLIAEPPAVIEADPDEGRDQD